jgi:hypothetical protein
MKYDFFLSLRAVGVRGVPWWTFEVEKVYLFGRKVINIFLSKFPQNDLEFAEYGCEVSPFTADDVKVSCADSRTNGPLNIARFGRAIQTGIKIGVFVCQLRCLIRCLS